VAFSFLCGTKKKQKKPRLTQNPRHFGSSATAPKKLAGRFSQAAPENRAGSNSFWLLPSPMTKMPGLLLRPTENTYRQKHGIVSKIAHARLFLGLKSTQKWRFSHYSQKCPLV
jgi:hypothetical protein